MLAKSLRLWIAFLLVAVVVVVTVAAVTAQAVPRTSPPVASEDWVPLGEHAGLAIVGRPSFGPVKVQLWIETGGRWEPALLQPPAKSVIPAR